MDISLAAQQDFHAFISIDLPKAIYKKRTKPKWHIEALFSMKIPQEKLLGYSFSLSYRAV